MARYVVNIDNSYKQPIGYHFTCNHCGEVNQKSYEFTVNVKASGSARNARGVQQLARRQHDKQVKKSVREKNRAIEKYRQKLLAGKTADGKLAYIPLNSECEHCGKCQMWNPAIEEKQYASKGAGILKIIGGIAGTLGFIGAFFTFFFLHAQGAGVSIGVPGALAGVALAGVVLYLIGSGINDRREAAWFREHLANEPNDPDKLPVIDG